MASSMAVWRAIDLVLRFAYVVLVPVMAVPMATVFPITGTFVGAAIATLVALLGHERWESAVGRIPLVGRALVGMAGLGDFYRAHPPKPLVYYIFYPVLLPVILFLRIPRREFLLYRSLNTITLVVVAITGVYEYVHDWYPELSFGAFVGIGIVTFVLQMLATFAIVMPIVTTLLLLRMRGRGKTLVALIALAGLAGAFGVLASHRMRGQLQIGTWARIEFRTRLPEAPVVLEQALDVAVRALKDHPDDRDTALDRARAKLATYYKPDEASAFKLYAGEGVTVLYVLYSKRDRVWRARDATHSIGDARELPPGARKVLRLD